MATETRSKVLAALDRVARTLAESWDLGELVSIREIAEAIRLHGTRTGLGVELHNRAAELRLRTERKVGGILVELRLHGGDRKSESLPPVVRLVDLRISRNQSARWQRLACMSEQEFEAYITEGNGAGEEITWAGAMKWRAKTTCGDANHIATAKRKGPDAREEKCEVLVVEPIDAKQCAPGSPSDSKLQRGGEVEELMVHLAEVIGHHQRLQALLKPLWSDEGAQLQNDQRRHVKGLFKEVEVSLTQMRAIVTRWRN